MKSAFETTEIEAEIKMEQCCRTCPSVDGINRFSIHANSEVNREKIANMLRETGGVQISAEDGLPQHICADCLMKLSLAHCFRLQCHRYDTYHREHRFGMPQTEIRPLPQQSNSAKSVSEVITIIKKEPDTSDYDQGVIANVTTIEDERITEATSESTGIDDNLVIKLEEKGNTSEEQPQTMTDGMMTLINVSTKLEYEEDRNIGSTTINDFLAAVELSPTSVDISKSIADNSSDATDVIDKEQEKVRRCKRTTRSRRLMDDEKVTASSSIKMEATEPKNKIPKKSSPFDNLEIERVKLLKVERQLVELNWDIKSCVGLHNADPEKCIVLMDEYQNLNITPIMLKKNPNCVELIKRLRKYKGNTKAWSMTDEERNIFETKALQIRNKAEEIYESFKTLFQRNVSNATLRFWDFFSEEVRKFEKAIRNMSQEERFLMVAEADRKHK